MIINPINSVSLLRTVDFEEKMKKQAAKLTDKTEYLLGRG